MKFECNFIACYFYIECSAQHILEQYNLLSSWGYCESDKTKVNK